MQASQKLMARACVGIAGGPPWIAVLADNRAGAAKVLALVGVAWSPRQMPDD